MWLSGKTQLQIVLIRLLQGFAESLQQDSSNQSEIVMIKLYCCGPDYCSIYPLLYYFFQIRSLRSSSSVAKILQNPVCGGGSSPPLREPCPVWSSLQPTLPGRGCGHITQEQPDGSHDWGTGPPVVNIWYSQL